MKSLCPKVPLGREGLVKLHSDTIWHIGFKHPIRSDAL